MTLGMLLIEELHKRSGTALELQDRLLARKDLPWGLRLTVKLDAPYSALRTIEREGLIESVTEPCPTCPNHTRYVYRIATVEGAQ